MNKILGASVLALMIGATGAVAQTSPSTPSTSTPSVEKTLPPAASAPTAVKVSAVLTEAQAKAWIKKAVYSNDGKNVGEVTSIQRDPSGKVTGMQIGIGGFLGMGETAVTLTPAQFELMNDRVELSLNAEQVKALPKAQK